MPQTTNNARRDGLYFVLLGCAVFLLFGFLLEAIAPHPVSDFRFVYNGARCMLQGIDPYQPGNFDRVYLADGGDLGSGSQREAYLQMSHHMYLPTSFIVVPLAILPWPVANVAWSILIAASFVLAAYLLWDLSAQYAPILAGILIFLLLAGSQSLLVIGNAAGLVVSLTAIAAWCFVSGRFERSGVVLLAISLMLKPHDAGLVWLYFLLAGGVYRRRALQSLALTAALSLPLLLWTTHVAPQWLPELRANLAFLAMPGHLNDPGPTSMAGHGMAMVISLQSVISLYRDDPRIYNLSSILICGIPLLLWAITTLRRRPTIDRTWLALACVGAFSLLPVYHRLGDAKLLLLTVPACCILWAKGGALRWIALAVNATALLLIGETQWALFLYLIEEMAKSASNSSRAVLIALQVLPVPLILLSVGLFYLSVYMKRPAAVNENE